MVPRQQSPNERIFVVFRSESRLLPPASGLLCKWQNPTSADGKNYQGLRNSFGSVCTKYDIMNLATIRLMDPRGSQGTNRAAPTRLSDGKKTARASVPECG
jgi:hypothetical protein